MQTEEKLSLAFAKFTKLSKIHFALTGFCNFIIFNWVNQFYSRFILK